GAPQPVDIIKSAAGSAAADIKAVVDEEVLDLYRDVVEELIAEKGAMESLCAALACMTGRTSKMEARSLLSNCEGHHTIMFTSDRPIGYTAYCWTALRRVFPPAITESIRGMQLSADSMSCLFDIPEEHLEVVKEKC
ncbi:unnamed protein product, partial [Choristocarpus tenellus]